MPNKFESMIKEYFRNIKKCITDVDKNIKSINNEYRPLITLNLAIMINSYQKEIKPTFEKLNENVKNPEIFIIIINKLLNLIDQLIKIIEIDIANYKDEVINEMFKEIKINMLLARAYAEDLGYNYIKEADEEVLSKLNLTKDESKINEFLMRKADKK